MRRLMIATALVLGLAMPAAAQEQDPEQVYKAAGALASKPVATIAYGLSSLQVADLRLPPGRGPFPVAVIIHGGCFMLSVDKRTGIAAFADALTVREPDAGRSACPVR